MVRLLFLVVLSMGALPALAQPPTASPAAVVVAARTWRYMGPGQMGNRIYAATPTDRPRGRYPERWVAIVLRTPVMWPSDTDHLRRVSGNYQLRQYDCRARRDRVLRMIWASGTEVVSDDTMRSDWTERSVNERAFRASLDAACRTAAR